jgi:Fe-S cluster assembly ATP-binding protein
VVRLLLEITDLAVEVSGKGILGDIDDLYIYKDETHVIIAPDGSGKSYFLCQCLAS